MGSKIEIAREILKLKPIKANMVIRMGINRKERKRDKVSISDLENLFPAKNRLSKL